MDVEVSTTHSWQWLLRNLSVSCRVNQFFFAIILMWYTRNIYNFFSSTEHCAWAIISPKEFKSCVTRISFAFNVLENRIICCQIFFQRIFNVLQLILVKIKWHIEWKYLIQKFYDICLSYYFKCPSVLNAKSVWLWLNL